MSGTANSSRCRIGAGKHALWKAVRTSLPVLAIGYSGFSAAAVAAPEATAREDSADNAPVAAASDQQGLSEIVVTATRRTETLQDIPYNISALSGATLTNSGVDSLNSLSQVVPGLQNVDTGPNTRGGNNNFSMRGLRTDGAGSGGGTPNYRNANVAPVSTYLGETPIFFPLAIKDIDRIEVLKGPQGTLYGSGAQAGTIRIIPNRPTFDSVSGNINTQGSFTEYSGKANYSVDGFINLPLHDNLALRVSAGYEHLGGFIDAVDLVLRQKPGDITSPPVSRVPGDPYSGYALAPVQKDVNNSNQWYTRAALRWQIAPAVDAELSYAHQYTHTADIQASNPYYPGGTYNFSTSDGTTGPGVDPNSANIYRPGGRYKSTVDTLSPTTNSLDLGNLVVSADLGFATVTTSTSGYSTVTDEKMDYTPVAEIFSPDGSVFNYSYATYGGFPRFNAASLSHSTEHAVTEELRLVSNGTGPVSYVVGGYYQDQRYNFGGQSIGAGLYDYLTTTGLNDVVGAVNGDTTTIYQYGENGYGFLDHALFGELTYKITPQWQVTGGTRFFWQNFTAFNDAFYFIGGAVDNILNINNTSKVHKHIWKANTSYDFSRDLKVYATYSEGFRRGGANSMPLSGVFAAAPEYSAFAPDIAKNYEIGVKGVTLGGTLRYTADAYLIDLNNFQFSAVSGAGAYPFVANGSTARSQGFEGDIEFLVSHDLSLHASYTYTDAKVRRGFTLTDYSFGALDIDPANPPRQAIATVGAGAPLPAVPKNTLNLGADYSVPVWGAAVIKLHADAGWKGRSRANIDPTSVYNYTIPSETQVNARVTYDSGSAWTADVFANNIANALGYSGVVGPAAFNTPFSNYYVERPRTIGAGLHYRF
jgi:iron complex outermembrane receptor protein